MSVGQSIGLSSISASEGSASEEYNDRTTKLHSLLRDQGYVRLDSSRGLNEGSGVHPLVAGVIGPSRRFFGLDALEKNKLTSNGDEGYRPAQKEKPEVFQVKLGGTESKPDFCSKAELALGRVLEDGRDILLGLGWHHSPTSPTFLSSLLDHRPLPPNSSSASQLRILNYHSGAGLSEHVDRGLLTIVVSADGGDSPLEVFDQLTNNWFRPTPGSCLLLVGHTLEAATAGLYKACLHRVVPSDRCRLSLAFQLRGRPDATLDWSFVPPGLRREAAPVQRGTSVAELMKKFEETHTSVIARGREGGEVLAAEAKRPKTSTGASSADDNLVTFIIRNQAEEDTYFRIKRSTRMEKVFETYARRVGIDLNKLCFILDGERYQGDATPRTLELEDGEVINVWLEQRGD